MNAYEKLNTNSFSDPLSETEFADLKESFQKEWLADINYEVDLKLHRNPAGYRYEVQRLLDKPLSEIQQRPELAHVSDNERSYVHHKVADIFERNNTLKGDYEAILIYCEKYQRDKNTTLMHLAEYKGLQELYFRMGSEIVNIKSVKMAKNFDVEIRETYDKPYLKVFLKADADFAAIEIYLASLQSVKRVNITDQKNGKRDLTIYPERVYDISEVREEINLALTNYFEGNPHDPIFDSEAISSISDQAYADIIKHIVIMGKNLEKFEKLNTNFDEERYRDYFIPYLNTISRKHSAKGEVFNRKGKSDILIFDNDGNNLFVAECKMWNGEAYLLNAIDQLLGNYVNWRDEKTALIVFNRDNKNFTDLVEKAVKAVESHKLWSKTLGRSTDASFSFSFSHPDDPRRSIKLELIIFNCA